jgi:predicted transcriptional regulator
MDISIAMVRFSALGKLETLVMETLWKSKEGVSGKEVHAKVHEQRHIALTTVLTVLERLQKKGLVNKLKDEGKAFRFAPSLSKEAFYRELSRQALQGLLGSSQQGALSAFADLLGSLTPEERAELDRLVGQRKGQDEPLEG